MLDQNTKTIPCPTPDIHLTIRALVKFDISDNSLCAAGAKTLGEALKGNQVLTELNIADNRMGMKTEFSHDGSDMSGAIAICDAIPTMRALTSLDISRNSLGGYRDDEYNWISDMSGVTALAAAIPECR